MQRRTLIATGAGALALAALLAWAFAPQPLEVETAPARVAPFEATLDEDGRTRLRERYLVSAPLAGRLARITLREGDAVAAGAVLATLAPVLSPLLDERSRAELRARAETADAALRAAATRSGAARIALEQALNARRRTEQLAAQGFVAPTQAENERLAVAAAQQALKAAQDGEHIAAHELAQARAALATLRDGARGGPGTADFAVRSPIAGRVLKLAQASEGVVALGAPLLEIGDTTQLEVVVELLTTEALQAAPGAEVRIERWGGPGVLAGRVARVEPAAFTKVSALGVEEQRVRVLIALTSPAAAWAALGDGFRVGVRIVTQREAQALQVPVSAVFPRPAAAGGGHAVFVVDGRRLRLQPVTVQARNASDAWIASGLAAGAQVVVYPPPAAADGVRVRLRKVE